MFFFIRQFFGNDSKTTRLQSGPPVEVTFHQRRKFVENDAEFHLNIFVSSGDHYRCRFCGP